MHPAGQARPSVACSASDFIEVYIRRPRQVSYIRLQSRRRPRQVSYIRLQSRHRPKQLIDLLGNLKVGVHVVPSQASKGDAYHIRDHTEFGAGNPSHRLCPPGCSVLPWRPLTPPIA